MNDISELEYVYTLVEELLLLPEFEKLRIQLHRYARETGQTGPVPRSPEMFGPYFSEDAKGYYLFCASKSPDSLSLWNYYVKDGKREGANIGFDPEALASILGCNIHRLYGLERVLSGPVVYDQRLQKEQLRGMFIEAQKKD